MFSTSSSRSICERFFVPCVQYKNVNILFFPDVRLIFEKKKKIITFEKWVSRKYVDVTDRQTHQSTHRQMADRERRRRKPGLEKYLNSTLPIGQVTLKFCLPGALPRLPKFSNSLIIHEPKNGSQTTGVFY